MPESSHKTKVTSQPVWDDFRLVNTNADYIEFVVSYSIGTDQWRVDGIGWMNQGKPAYYLRLLRLDGLPVTGKYYEKALLAEKNGSFKFRNKLLDSFTVTRIGNYFKSDKKT